MAGALRASNDLQNRLILQLFSYHGLAVILITAVMAAAVLDLNLIRLHGWAMMEITIMMTGYGEAVMGVTAIIAFAF